MRTAEAAEGLGGCVVAPSVEAVQAAAADVSPASRRLAALLAGGRFSVSVKSSRATLSAIPGVPAVSTITMRTSERLPATAEYGCQEAEAASVVYTVE
jgi:hypothetical protein